VGPTRGWRRRRITAHARGARGTRGRRLGHRARPPSQPKARKGGELGREAPAGPQGGSWAARRGEGEGGKEKRNKRFLFLFNLFSKCMISQIHPTNKINAWSGMVQQPKDLTLGFCLHKMPS
jgi:hypothetical protein